MMNNGGVCYGRRPHSAAFLRLIKVKEESESDEIEHTHTHTHIHTRAGWLAGKKQNKTKQRKKKKHTKRH